MKVERIKEIQEECAYPESVSVQQALFKVWNECEKDKPQWISVEERLPDGKCITSCLVFKDCRFVTEAIYNGKVKKYLSLDFKDINSTVTHWMPLPEPPKK